MRHRASLLPILAALTSAALPAFGDDELAAAGIGTPVGAWSCMLYEQRGDESEPLLMRFDPDGTAHFARLRGEEFRLWSPVSAWTARRNQLSFSDSRSGRAFEADLGRSGLGGTWTGDSAHGGWWCAELAESFVGDGTLETLSTEDLMPPLVALGASTPLYPLPAIRLAMEGHAAVCFLVEATGRIVRPEIIDVSDELFRLTSLRAVMASTYRGWQGGPAFRPGCRTFSFELDRAG